MALISEEPHEVSLKGTTITIYKFIHSESIKKKDNLAVRHNIRNEFNSSTSKPRKKIVELLKDDQIADFTQNAIDGEELLIKPRERSGENMKRFLSSFDIDHDFGSRFKENYNKVKDYKIFFERVNE